VPGRRDGTYRVASAWSRGSRVDDLHRRSAAHAGVAPAGLARDRVRTRSDATVRSRPRRPARSRTSLASRGRGATPPAGPSSRCPILPRRADGWSCP